MRWLAGFRSSLRKKIIITSLLCLVVPVGGILMISSSFAMDLIKERVENTASESLQVTEVHVTAVMNNLIRITNNIQFDPELNSLLRTPLPEGSQAIGLQQKIEDKLKTLTSDSPGIYISIVFPQDHYYSNYSYYDYQPSRFKSEPWFPILNKMETFETYWVGVQPTYLESERERNPYLITIARTLRDFSLNPYAYVIVSVQEKQLRTVMTEYSESQRIMLLSGDGTLLSGIGSIGETFPRFQELSKAENNSVFTSDGAETIVVKRPLPIADWSIVSLTSYDKAASRVQAIFRSNFIMQIGLIAAFLVILIYFLRQFTKPILRLVQIASSIEAGNLSVRSHIQGPDEFVKLGRSFDHMLDSIETMVQQITYEQEQKRRAELAMLQAQIHPHFLFNILNAIRLKIMRNGDKDNASIISSLTRLLRHTIAQDHEYVTLQDEVGLVEDYMKLMRFTSRYPFEYEIQLSSETLLAMVPRFIIQPIIENALVHGLKQKQGTIRIHAWKEDTSLLVTIEDNGYGMDSEELDSLRRKLPSGYRGKKQALPQSEGMSGIGLVNVYERLHMVYGDAFEMKIDSLRMQGTQVKITIKGGERIDQVEGDASR
ncbi:histidine kinase [Paenibacillus silviterrae]|uniref:histidine kinase n=1 Tax=Paenibacillus silviterrae TaxID=3242194 RepID=UPI00254334DD|nr:histidine kinase [Paenibacillus chinjuensis]